jgi:hypothetical protein
VREEIGDREQKIIERETESREKRKEGETGIFVCLCSSFLVAISYTSGIDVKRKRKRRSTQSTRCRGWWHVKPTRHHYSCNTSSL